MNKTLSLSRNCTTLHRLCRLCANVFLHLLLLLFLLTHSQSVGYSLNHLKIILLVIAPSLHTLASIHTYRLPFSLSLSLSLSPYTKTVAKNSLEQVNFLKGKSLHNYTHTQAVGCIKKGNKKWLLFFLFSYFFAHFGKLLLLLFAC